MLNFTSTRQTLMRFALALSMFAGASGVRADDMVDYFRAVELDNVGAVERLLAASVDPNAIDPGMGETGMIIALRENAMRVFNRLLADPKTKLEATARNGNTALMMAAFKHNKPAVLALLDKGAVVNRPGWTALHYAAASGDNDIVKILLDHKAAIDCTSPGKSTPLMIAAREGFETTVQALLDAGANPALVDGEGLTALAIAERADKPLIVAALKGRSAPAK